MLRAVFAFGFVLMLAGCATAPVPEAGLPTGAPTTNQKSMMAAVPATLRFPGAASTLNTSFDDSFGPSEWCSVSCQSDVHTHEIAIPEQVPVQIHVESEGPGQFDIYTNGEGLTYSRYEQNGEGRVVVLDMTVLKAAGGRFEVVVYYLRPEGTDTEPSVHTTVSALAVPALLPPGMPVAVKLSAGQWLNATAPGFDSMYVIDDAATITRILAPPYAFQAGNTSTYTLIVSSDEPATVTGPNQTFVPRSYEYEMGEVHDIVAGEATTWEQPFATSPIGVGLRLICKDAGVGCPAAFRGDGSYEVLAPNGEQLLEWSDACVTPCSLTVLGSYGSGRYGGYFSEALSAGSFKVNTNVQAGREMQGYLVAVNLV